MAITIGSNIASLNAQRRLGEAANGLSRSFERLSSGQRINRASDDAAGLAVATSLSVSSRVFGQGIRNINDGLSALNIADGALGSLSTILTRIQELSEQAANGSYSSTQRQALDSEAQALNLEYRRVVSVTKFNGINLIDGSFSNARIQAGFGSNESIEVSVGNIFSSVTHGDGTFKAATIAPVTGASTLALLTSADLNGDSKADLVMGAAGNSVRIALGNGDGTFKSAVSILSMTDPESVAATDVNGDGKIDIISAEFLNPGTLRVSIGNGDGTFKAAISYGPVAGGWTLNLGDFDGDGIQDVVAGEYNGLSIAMFSGNSDGSFKAPTHYNASPVGSPVNGSTSGDFNGDGKLDIAVSNLFTARVSVLLGNGNGSFLAPVSYFTETANPFHVKNGDFNRDGYLDLLVSNNLLSSFDILLGNGNGTFKAHQSFTASGTTNSVSVADLNGDSYLDVAAAQYTVDKLMIFLGNGDGGFKAAVSYQAGDGPYHPVIADFNGDGGLDIVTTDFLGGSISIFLANTNTTFTAGLGTISLLNQADARTTLTRAQEQLTSLSQEIGKIGAHQSRLNIALRNLQTTKENYDTAYSRIVDTDIAEETAELVRKRILQDAGAAILSQANVQPNLALMLLRG